MELLYKSVRDEEDKRKDNSDKKRIFSKDEHLESASFYKSQWSFINDISVRENIAYQMQYLEFMVRLYNEYQIYLTLESLLCKDIMVTVGGIVEAALFDLIYNKKTSEGRDMGERKDLNTLLGTAYHEYKLIDRNLWHFFHELRKTRNKVHLKSADFQEHVAYTIEQANEAIEKLEEFRKNLE